MKREITFAEKNDFIVKYADVKYFEKDRDYFIKVFPYSPLVAGLKKANQFNKKNLDERILLELLKNVCPEAILEARGIIKPSGVTTFDAKAEAQKEILNVASLDDLSLTRKKEIIKALELDVENEEVESIDIALTDYIKSLEEPMTKEDAEEKLKTLTLDLDTDYDLMKGIIEVLGIKTDGESHKTFVFALKEFRGDIVTVGNDGNLPAEKDQINTELREAKTLDDIPYNRKKQIISILDLTVENQKEVSLDTALTKYMSADNAPVQDASNDPKKKEGQE